MKISDAAALALHALVFLAAEPKRRVATGEIASGLHCSEAHLSKVLQRLAKVGLVKSVRGPKGGFSLGREPAKITLLDAYEAIEGPLTVDGCILKVPTCSAKRCIFGSVGTAVNAKMRDYLAKTKLSKLGDVFGSK